MAGGRWWTEDEDRAIRDAAAANRNADVGIGVRGLTGHLRGVARELGRSYGAVRSRAIQIGATSRGKARWTDDEDQAIRDAAEANVTASEGIGGRGRIEHLRGVARELGRSYGAVRSRAIQIGATSRGKARWTDDEDQAIRDAAEANVTASEGIGGRSRTGRLRGVARELGRSYGAVRNRAIRIGAMSKGEARWTGDEDQAIRDAAEANRNSDVGIGGPGRIGRLRGVARELGRSYGAVRNRAIRIGATSRGAAR